jgi:hypothetical protein
MNSIEMEIENAHRRQLLMEEAQIAHLLQGAKEARSGFVVRTLLFIAAIMIALGTHIQDWYNSAGSQGYLPNLHLD